MSLTPQQVERRLLDLSKEIDEAQVDLETAEKDYHMTKAEYEIAMARSRMGNTHPDVKMTSTQREDQAILDNRELLMELAITEARVKASRGNMQRIRTQVDIARSISVSVRASMEII